MFSFGIDETIFYNGERGRELIFFLIHTAPLMAALRSILTYKGGELRYSVCYWLKYFFKMT